MIALVQPRVQLRKFPLIVFGGITLVGKVGDPKVRDNSLNRVDCPVEGEHLCRGDETTIRLRRLGLELVLRSQTRSQSVVDVDVPSSTTGAGHKLVRDQIASEKWK